MCPPPGIMLQNLRRKQQKNQYKIYPQTANVDAPFSLHLLRNLTTSDITA